MYDGGNEGSWGREGCQIKVACEGGGRRRAEEVTLWCTWGAVRGTAEKFEGGKGREGEGIRGGGVSRCRAEGDTVVRLGALVGGAEGGLGGGRGVRGAEREWEARKAE